MKNRFLIRTVEAIASDCSTYSTGRTLNSGDTGEEYRQFMLLSEIHDVLSQNLLSLPCTKRSWRCGNWKVPNALDDCTSWINRPGTQLEKLKKHSLPFSNMVSADAFTLGGAKDSTGVWLSDENLKDVAAIDKEIIDSPAGVLQMIEESDVHNDCMHDDLPIEALADVACNPKNEPNIRMTTAPVVGILDPTVALITQG